MLHHESSHEAETAISDTNRLAPLLSAHTQAAAYLIGETAAEKIIAEYT